MTDFALTFLKKATAFPVPHVDNCIAEKVESWESKLCHKRIYHISEVDELSHTGFKEHGHLDGVVTYSETREADQVQIRGLFEQLSEANLVNLPKGRYPSSGSSNFSLPFAFAVVCVM